MGIPKHAVPDAAFRLMSKADQARVRPSCAGSTRALACTPSAPSRADHPMKDHRSERQLQEDMANLLNQRSIFYLRSRMDKKTTLPVGMPDFFIFPSNGRYLAVEAKVQGGELSDDQKRVFDRFWAYTGKVVHIVWNLD